MACIFNNNAQFKRVFMQFVIVYVQKIRSRRKKNTPNAKLSKIPLIYLLNRNYNVIPNQAHADAEQCLIVPTISKTFEAF